MISVAKHRRPENMGANNKPVATFNGCGRLVSLFQSVPRQVTAFTN